MRNLLIVGAGGHGKVVADAAIAARQWSSIAFIDDRYPMNSVLDWPVVGSMDHAGELLNQYSDLIVAIGNNFLRVRLLKKFKETGFHIPTIIHPKASVSEFAELGEGTVVFAQAAVNAGTRIGLGSIVNTGSSVDHDCILGEGVHVCPGVHLAGGVQVGNCSWLGIGSTIIQNVTIGSNVTIGAGSVILHNVEDGSTVVGVPGKVIKKAIAEEC
jgi:sugar O-acyltransferase (sialic acid O-acetyltransferase NeuD family)